VAAGLNVEIARGRRFYIACGFEEEGALAFDLLLTPADRVTPDEERCGTLEPVNAPSFVQLYQAIFPMADYSGERVVRMIGQSHQVFVALGEAAEGEEVFGFAVVAVDEARTSGEIQFLGIREDCRGRGYGRRLLLSAVDWLLDEVGASVVCLAVNERNQNALHLYQSVGFKLRNTGVGLTKEV
jgi:ribosomal protein S18 acetylase RimI-like enzyme